MIYVGVGKSLAEGLQGRRSYENTRIILFLLSENLHPRICRPGPWYSPAPPVLHVCMLFMGRKLSFVKHTTEMSIKICCKNTQDLNQF